MKYSLFVLIISLLIISCGNPVPRKPVVRKTSSFLKESVNFNKSLISEEEEAFKSYIKNDSLNTYLSSTKGFWYKYEQKNTSDYSPRFGDKLTYTYAVYDLDNSIIYDYNEIGEKQYFVDQQEIVEGLRNGLKLMSEGDIVTFLFPSHKVFGYLGDQKKIAINQPLIYKVQLNKIEKKNESN